MLVVALPDHPPFSWLIFCLLIIILVASIVVFQFLVRRWTSRRQWVSLAQWTRESSFKLRPARQDLLPKPLDALVHADEQIRFHLCDPRSTFVQFDSAPQPPSTLAPTWNVLIRRRPNPGPVAGLRPVSQPASLLDLMELTRFPAMTSSDRFTVHAADYTTARRLADTSARALLPPDVGLILLKDHIVLDFSARPFDPIEFERMLSIADQLGGFVG